MADPVLLDPVLEGLTVDDLIPTSCNWSNHSNKLPDEYPVGSGRETSGYNGCYQW